IVSTPVRLGLRVPLESTDRTRSRYCFTRDSLSLRGAPASTDGGGRAASHGTARDDGVRSPSVGITGILVGVRRAVGYRRRVGRRARIGRRVRVGGVAAALRGAPIRGVGP